MILKLFKALLANYFSNNNPISSSIQRSNNITKHTITSGFKFCCFFISNSNYSSPFLVNFKTIRVY